MKNLNADDWFAFAKWKCANDPSLNACKFTICFRSNSPTMICLIFAGVRELNVFLLEALKINHNLLLNYIAWGPHYNRSSQTSFRNTTQRAETGIYLLGLLILVNWIHGNICGCYICGMKLAHCIRFSMDLNARQLPIILLGYFPFQPCWHRCVLYPPF